MKKLHVLNILTIIALLLVFVSCDTAVEENNADSALPDYVTENNGHSTDKEENDTNYIPIYAGTWKNLYNEIYKITETTFICDSNGYGFEANNLVADKKDDKSGIFYMQITKNNGWWSNSDPVGKWYAVAYKNMTDTTLSLSNACTAYPECEMDCQNSLEAAKAHFDAEKYFTYYGEFVKE